MGRNFKDLIHNFQVVGY